jgi:DNA-binding response OmpR family regulator
MATTLAAKNERNLNNLVRRHLLEEDHRVLQAFDGPRALAATTREGPELVVLDWMLPRLDGPEVCRRVRRRSPSSCPTPAANESAPA